ncbi:hypothetical protein [Microtetraspora malaysiensis]|uniref:VG15 protein n=1 Tax=Microtetraspora malaysiensis TaxID=161358 RepID=UPI003D8E8406
MATPAEVAAYRASQQDVVALAHAELAAWWASQDISDPRAAATALETTLPDLVAAYGDMAMAVAADWYDMLREQAQASGAYRAALAGSLPVEQVQAVARWGAAPLFGEPPDPAKALSMLSGAVQRLVQQGGRDTLWRNAQRDPSGVRWARVPHGAKTCAWCRMLASRGAVYLTRKSAGGGMNSWHNRCDCTPTPVWQDQALPYDADALYQEYINARDAAGSGNPTMITAQMRRDLGIN